MSHIAMPRHKPWFLRNKLKHGSIGEWSHLTRHDLFELLDSVDKEIAELYQKRRHPRWSKVREAALEGLSHLAEKHRCVAKLNTEGGDICFYYHGEPVFSLRIGAYVKPAVSALAESEAFYRGIIDVRNRYTADFLPSITTKDGYLVPSRAKSFYHMMPVRGASKWRAREASDMLCIVDCIREDSSLNLTSRDITGLVKMNRHKVLRLLGRLEDRGIIYRKGRSVSTGWYPNRTSKWESKSGSKSSSESSSEGD